MQKINSRILGPLEQDNQFPDWWNSANVSVPLFDNKELSFVYMEFVPESDSQFMIDADNAVENFLQLGNDYRFAISPHIYDNFKSIASEVDEPYWDQTLNEIGNDLEIWKFVEVIGAEVSRRSYGEQDIYILLTCRCAWEEEHGLQLVFRQGKQLTRVSQVDGHLTEADAYDIPDEEDKLLSQFQP